MNKPLISVILPIYNVDPYLEKCLKSLQEQTYTNFEALLVDDGSTDNSGAICRFFSAQDSRFVYLPKMNGGVSDARNYGLKKVSGKYISFIDPDDYVASDYLEYLLEIMLLNKSKISACNHWICREERKTSSTQISEASTFFELREAYEKVLYHDTLDVSVWGKLYERDIFDTIRFPKGKIYEDTDVFARIISIGKGISFGYKPHYYYQIRAKSITTTEFDDRKLQYIDAVENMCGVILLQFPELADACIRRRVHAHISTLRFMKTSGKYFENDKEKIISFIKSNGRKVLKDMKAPTADKVAVISLFLGENVFHFAWSIFCKITGRIV